MSRVGPKAVPEQLPNQSPARQAVSAAPQRRAGPDGFEEVGPRKAPIALQPREGPVEALKRTRMLDPHLIPLVPPNATNDPGRQVQALLGLRPVTKAPTASKPGILDLDGLLAQLPPQRTKFLKALLDGADSPAKAKLQALLAGDAFRALAPEAQKKALLTFNPRAK